MCGTGQYTTLDPMSISIFRIFKSCQFALNICSVKQKRIYFQTGIKEYTENVCLQVLCKISAYTNLHQHISNKGVLQTKWFS